MGVVTGEIGAVVAKNLDCVVQNLCIQLSGRMRRRLVGPAEGRTIAANRHLAAVPYPEVAALALRTVTQRSRVLVSAAVQYAVRPMTGRTPRNYEQVAGLARWPSGQGAELAINRSRRVRLPATALCGN